MLIQVQLSIRCCKNYIILGCPPELDHFKTGNGFICKDELSEDRADLFRRRGNVACLQKFYKIPELFDQNAQLMLSLVFETVHRDEVLNGGIDSIVLRM